MAQLMTAWRPICMHASSGTRHRQHDADVGILAATRGRKVTTGGPRGPLRLGEESLKQPVQLLLVLCLAGAQELDHPPLVGWVETSVREGLLNLLLYGELATIVVVPTQDILK